MWIADGWEDYELLDCGKGEKLERWGSYTLVRPDPQAIWNTPAVTLAGNATMPAMPALIRAGDSGSKRTCPSGGRSAMGP